MEGPEFCFILYQPAVPGNIGAAARAMKTMGFDQLRLVSPADHLSDEAMMMAHGSHEILQKSKIYSTYDEAVADADLILCTTAKNKSAKVDYIPSRDLKGFLSEKLPVTRMIAIVFGTEESGLPNEILLTANAGITIPMTVKHPSLNLAQAVMIIAYELSGLLHEKSPRASRHSGDNEELQQPSTWKQLHERTADILQESGILPGTPLYHRIIERMSFMKASDARLAHSVTSKVKELITELKQKK